MSTIIALMVAALGYMLRHWDVLKLHAPPNPLEQAWKAKQKALQEEATAAAAVAMGLPMSPPASATPAPPAGK